MNKNLKVSVIVPTYNHEDNISKAIDSILKQKTEFNYEILVGEDDSQDATRKICKKYAEKYPDKIELFLNDRENVIYVNNEPTGRWNLMNLISNAKGDYIAVCEGDDYWIDEEKLQKQVEYMENNEEVVLCFHPVKWEQNGIFQESPKSLPPVDRDYYTDKDLLQYDNFISTCSVMFQNGLIEEFPEWFKRVPFGDVALHILNAQYGKIGYIDQEMAVYRDDNQGMYSGQKDIDNCLNSIQTYKIIADNLSCKDSVEYKYGLAKLYNWLSELAAREGQKCKNEIAERVEEEENKNNPLVSVIIPTYNRPQKLRNAIESVLDQTIDNIEIIVVNDGGQNISNVIESFDNSIINLINHDKNRGLAAARNTGIKNTQGKYVALLDDDDAFYPEHLQIALEYLESGEEVIYTDAERYVYTSDEKEEKKLVKKHVPYSIDYDREKLLCGNIAPVNCYVFNRELAEKVEYFDENLPVLEDWDFWLRISKFTDFKHIEKVTAQVNWDRNDSMTDQQMEEFEKTREKIYRKNANQLANIDNIEEIFNEFEKVWEIDDILIEEEPMDNEYNKTSIIMLTYNQLEYTKQCINSIFRNTKVPYELIIVDNNSTDGTVEYLKNLAQKKDKVKVILNDKNIGFPAGNNKGMEIATGDYIQLLNNDVLIPEGWLQRLINCADADESIGLVGPITNTSSGLQQLKKVPYDDVEGFYEFANYVAQKNRCKYTPRTRLSAFALLIKRKVYEEIGGLDTDFGKGNFEDDDYCLRAREAGYRVMLAEDVFIHHYANVSFNASDIDFNKLLQENKEIFQEKWPGMDPQELSQKDQQRLFKQEKRREEAQKYIEQKQYEKAHQEFLTVLENNPVNKEALMGMALMNRGIEKHEKALEWLDSLLDIDPEDEKAKNLYGIYMYEQGNLEEAKNIFEEIIEKNPEMIDARSNLSEVYIALEEYQKGVDQLIEVLEIDPQDVPAMLRMSQLNLEVGRYEEAEEYVQKALKYEPQNDEAREVKKLVDEKIQN